MGERRVVGWLRERHSLAAEAGVIVLLYALYETSRGLVAGDRAGAVHHAHTIAAIERSLHVFAEADVQRAAGALPGLVGTLGVLYLTLHLTITGACLLWLHQRRPGAFPAVRTALLIASGLALVGYLVLPTAPPRLAGLGIADSISQGHVDLNHGLVSSLYNPFAAFPSVHIAYAALVGGSVVRWGSTRLVRAAGAVYPALVLLVIVATGNHFFLDAVGGAAVAALAAGAAGALLAPPAAVRLATPVKA